MASLQHRRDEIESEIRFQFSRSSGPGGQNVNKVASKARAAFDLRASQFFTAEEKARIVARLADNHAFDAKTNEIVVVSQEHRTQLQNRIACVDKIIRILELGLTRIKKRKPTKKTKSSERRRLDSKRVHATKKANRRRNDRD